MSSCLLTNAINISKADGSRIHGGFLDIYHRNLGRKAPRRNAQRCVLPVSFGFTNMAVINPLERKLAKRTSVEWGEIIFEIVFQFSCTSVITRFFCNFLVFEVNTIIARENS